jgi:hypothetical protein
MRSRFLPEIFILLCLVVVAPPILRADPILAAHIETLVSPPGVWSYTLFNDEPLASSNYIFAFSLTINAPVVVTGVPDGWTVDTDNVSFVFWFNTDLALPYPHDIAPGSSLGGFSISSPGAVPGLSSAAIAGWDHLLDAPGPLSSDILVSSPSSPTPVPEPSSAMLLVAPLFLMFFYMLRYRRSL